MSLKKARCTVIIVDPKRGHSRSISVPSPLLYNLRYYLVAILLVVAALTTVCMSLYASVNRHEEERSSLVSRMSILEKQIPKSSDTLNARNYVERIETKLQKINEYLRKRGVKGFSPDAVGGEDNAAMKLAPIEYYSMYDKYVERIFEGLTYTPMGFPTKTELTSDYGYRQNPFHGRSVEFHSGIDFRGSTGDQVRSTASGEVIHAGWNGGYGICVQVRHKDGFETLYGHLSKSLVKAGEKIAVGQVVGEVGTTGRSSGAHLHYEVRKNGTPVNPVHFLNLE